MLHDQDGAGGVADDFEEIDLAEIDAVRAGWPFFRDRRIDAYADITKRFGND